MNPNHMYAAKIVHRATKRLTEKFGTKVAIKPSVDLELPYTMRFEASEVWGHVATFEFKPPLVMPINRDEVVSYQLDRCAEVEDHVVRMVSACLDAYFK